MSLKLNQRRLDNKIWYLRETLEIKAKILKSIENINASGISKSRKDFMLKGKKTGLRKIENKELAILKDIERQAKKINKKYSKISL